MKKQTRLCPFCKCEFIPSPYNEFHQVYCSDSVCQRESHRVSSKKNRLKVENENPEKYREQQEESKKRVRYWRQNNPGYWRRTGKKQKKCINFDALRDLVRGEIEPLRDFVILQCTVIKLLVEIIIPVT